MDIKSLNKVISYARDDNIIYYMLSWISPNATTLARAMKSKLSGDEVIRVLLARMKEQSILTNERCLLNPRRWSNDLIREILESLEITHECTKVELYGIEESILRTSDMNLWDMFLAKGHEITDNFWYNMLYIRDTNFLKQML